jgi:hypothetical protein
MNLTAPQKYIRQNLISLYGYIKTILRQAGPFFKKKVQKNKSATVPYFHRAKGIKT